MRIKRRVLCLLEGTAGLADRRQSRGGGGGLAPDGRLGSLLIQCPGHGLSRAASEGAQPANLVPPSAAGGTGSAFPFDFGRLPHKARRPAKDPMAASRSRSSPEASPLEWNGGRPAAEMQLKVQSQQEEVEQLKKELASQKVGGQEGRGPGPTCGSREAGGQAAPGPNACPLACDPGSAPLQETPGLLASFLTFVLGPEGAGKPFL